MHARLPAPTTRHWLVPFACALTLLAGCGGSAPIERATLVARAATFSPVDPKLADLYQHSCKACHIVVTSGAPLSGDRDAWQPRMKKGLPTLVNNAIIGLNGMPAGGQCVRCTTEDYRLLIRFMAGESP
ncbi:MAG: c-type cytochrome [Pseudomonadota bacterium]